MRDLAQGHHDTQLGGAGEWNQQPCGYQPTNSAELMPAATNGVSKMLEKLFHFDLFDTNESLYVANVDKRKGKKSMK